MSRKYALKSTYGITEEQYLQLLAEQNGGCAICGKPPGKRQLAVDHCHKTGVIRGLLCGRCNLGLGFIETMAPEAITAYLQKPRDSAIRISAEKHKRLEQRVKRKVKARHLGVRKLFEILSEDAKEQISTGLMLQSLEADEPTRRYIQRCLNNLVRLEF